MHFIARIEQSPTMRQITTKHLEEENQQRMERVFFFFCKILENLTECG